jgi:hypothetical protein
MWKRQASSISRALRLDRRVSGLALRLPTVETNSMSGSSTDSCEASRALNSSSSAAQPTSS